MFRKFLTALYLIVGQAVCSQVIINELDTDTPGTDVQEFVELKTETPNFPLDGYVLVFYNGSSASSTGNKCYYVIDLDGLVSDVNGIALIGNGAVSPYPDYVFPNSVIQNGEDAIALYLGNASDFPNLTDATSVNLIDALAYDTDDADATSLMSLLGLTEQINENQNALGTTQSIQRKPDGSWEVKSPTPGSPNDGSGFVYNKVSASLNPSEMAEGGTFTITFTTDTAVITPLTFSISLSNGTFDTADFTGSTSITIPAGSASATYTYTLVDDAADEGDEQLQFAFGVLPFGYKKGNNMLRAFVIDNDFTTAAYGTPLNPTYGIVTPDIPEGYYDSLYGKAGDELKNAIRDIIANPAVVHAQNYGDIEYMLKEADVNPENSNQVWLMYVEQGRGKYKFQSTSSNVGAWNREHIFPQSRGGFSDGTDSQADGIDVWETTNADDIAAGHGDGHHIRAEDGPENTSRSNRDYGTDYNGPAGNQDSWKGDVARALFYMAVRYNALSLVNGNPPDTTLYQMADLASLLAWNQTDPADDFEMHHNNVIYDWQRNRNPFVDHPELADYLWGAMVGQPYEPQLGTPDHSAPTVVLYPNPSHGVLNLRATADWRLELYAQDGRLLMSRNGSGNATFDASLPSGMYFAKVASANAYRTFKLLLR